MNTLKTSTIYYALAFVVLALGVVYGVTQFNLMSAEQTAVIDNQETMHAMSTVIAREQSDYKIFAEKQATLQAMLVKNIAAVLPMDDNYTDLTRLFDDYFGEHDTAQNPIVQSSLRFGKGAPLPGNANVSVLPISMNLEGTRDNFFKFVDFISHSGALDTGTRLMSINSIQINFPEGGEVLDNARQVINFTVDMNAYYQTPKIKTK